MFRFTFNALALRAPLLGACAPLLTKMAPYTNLVKDKAFINGDWVSASNGATFDVTNPSTEAKITSVPDMGAAETKTAIAAAQDAFDGWRALPAKQRCDILLRWSKAVSREAEPLAMLITAENGKSLADSTAEVAYGNGFLEWFAAQGRHLGGEIITSPVASKRLLTIHQPIGPVGIITPWNFPLAMITRKVRM